MKLTRTKIALAGLALLGGTSVTPLVPYDVPPEKIVSYETVMFDTLDGDLDLDQYAVNPAGGYFIRTVPKDQGNFNIAYDSATSSPIVGKTEVKLVCEKCAYYQNYVAYDGTMKRAPYDQLQYQTLATKDAPPATKTELITPLQALAKPAQAAIATDSTGTAVSGLNAVTSLTYAVNNTSGTVLFTCISSNVALTGVTYNSVSETLINNSGGAQPAILYYIANPSTGSNNVVVTTGSSAFIYSASSAYTGAKTTGIPDAQATNSGSLGVGVALTTSVTTVADNSWGILCARNDTSGSEAASTGSTGRVGIGSGLVQIFDTNGPKTPAGSLSMSTTDTNARVITHAMASFAPSTAARFNPAYINVW